MVAVLIQWSPFLPFTDIISFVKDMITFQREKSWMCQQAIKMRFFESSQKLVLMFTPGVVVTNMGMVGMVNTKNYKSSYQSSSVHTMCTWFEGVSLQMSINIMEIGVAVLSDLGKQCLAWTLTDQFVESSVQIETYILFYFPIFWYWGNLKLDVKIKKIFPAYLTFSSNTAYFLAAALARTAKWLACISLPPNAPPATTKRWNKWKITIKDRGGHWPKSFPHPR